MTQNLATLPAREDGGTDLATFRAMGFEDSAPEAQKLLVDAMASLTSVNEMPPPSSDSQIRWQSLLDRFGLTDISINDLAVWSDVIEDDDHAYRFTLNEY